jgi:hypothetical protein
MFNPQEERWRSKALADARLAFTGILRAEEIGREPCPPVLINRMVTAATD